MQPPDTDSLEQFLAERGGPLLRAAKLLTGSQEAAEDLLQAALERLLMTGAAAAAAVTAAIVAVPGPAPRLQTAAYVVSRVQGALTQASSQDYIQYRRETTTARIFLSNDVSGPSVGSWTYRGQARTWSIPPAARSPRPVRGGRHSTRRRRAGPRAQAGR